MALVLLLLVIPAFHQCHDLMDYEVLSSHPSFETAHPEEMAGQTYKFAGLASNISALTPFAAPTSIEEVLLSPFPFPVPSKQPLVLRR